MASRSYHSSDSLQGVCVLVVETEHDGPRLLAPILKYCGAYVKAPGSAKEALDDMENLRPDAIIIRLSHPEMFSLVTRVRVFQSDSGGSVPIVGITKESRPSGPRRFGCDAYLIEPIDPWELCRVVGRLVVIT